MKKNLLAISFAVIFTSLAGNLTAGDNPKVGKAGDSAQGKEKAGTCSGCHGEDGNSLVANFPKLAQQHSSYLVKQLYAFKDGSRKDAVMSGIVATLNDDDIADLAAYYAGQSVSANPEPSLPPADEDDADADEAAKDPKQAMAELLQKGSNMYRNGHIATGVSACIACHGPSGEGNKPAAFPALRSQHADYLIKSLTDYKSGARSKNPDNMMVMITKKMSDEEIKAVSYYISTMK